MKTCKHEGCTFPVFGKGYCKSHQRCRPDYKPPDFKPRAPIRKVSKKRARELRIYNKRTPSWKDENSKCCFPGCECEIVDRHHVIGQGIHMNDERYHIPLCRAHHDLCKSNPKLAMELNLIQTRTIVRKNRSAS